MKNLNNLLRRANITPLERVAALVRNNSHKEKTGKGILSESELYTLTDGWKAQGTEVKEYNRYINIARLEGSMRMDAQMFSYHSELSVVRNQRLLAHCISDLEKMKGADNGEITKGLTEEERIGFATKHTYLEYRYVLHTFTFDNLPKEIQEDLLLLDDSIVHSKRYLEDEVFLCEKFKDGKLSKKNKDALVDAIFSRMYHEGIQKMRNGTEKDGFMIGDSFAELPLKEVMHRVAHDAGIKWKDKDEEELLEDIEKYATGKDVTMEHLVREALHVWLDDGLFTKHFVPICASDRFDTRNGNTKKSHKELFAIWYAELEKSKKYFAGLFNARKLKRQEAGTPFFGETKIVEMITGESLYVCKEDANFVREYKKQVEMIMPFSNFALFIEKHAKPVRNYATLCEFRRMAEKAADIFSADFTEEYDKLIESYKDEMALLNHDLNRLTDMATEHLYTDKKEATRYDIHFVNGGLGFVLEEGGDTADIVQKYAEEFKKLSV